MTAIETPDFTGSVDTEQTIIREISLADAGDDRFDVRSPYRGGTFRPTRIKLIYRVNRYTASPHWYLFRVKIMAAKVLKSGKTSDAYVNQIAENFYPEHAPVWAREIGAQLKPVVEIERHGFGSPAGEEYV